MPTYTINPFGRTNRLDLAGVTTVSGALTTLVELTDTPSVYEDGKYLKSTVAGTEWATGDGGITVHSELTNLAYADSGHTGFAPTSHSHTESDISDLDKYTEAEVNTISGALNTKISGKADTSHTHDDRYYTESEVDTISGSLNTKIDGKADTGHIHDDRYYTETELDAGQLDNRYYTESEVDTISGSLNIKIEAKPDTLLELIDTPAAYEEGKYLKSSAGAIEFVTPEGIALVAEVKEENISAITKGQMCAITGSSGAKFEVGLCDCDDATKIRVIGLAQTNIARNEEGVVVYKGELLNVDSRATNTDVNPNAEEWDAGDLLYVSQTPGGLTKVRPTSGRCIKAGRTQKGNSSSDTFLAIVDVNSICACAAAGEDLCHRMGDVAGVNKVSYRSYDSNEVAAFDSYGNLTLSGTVDGRDVATDGSKLDGIATGADVTGDNPPQAHTHDDRYYTESEVDTISGTLSSEIDSDISTHTSNADAHHNESHTVASHSDTTATGEELNALTDGSETTLHKHKRYIQIRLLDKDTSHTVSNGVAGDFRFTQAMTVTGVACYFDTAGTTSVTTLDINESGTTILSTKLTVDATEKTSETAATPAVISDSAIAANAIITFDLDGIASGTAGKGLIIELEVTTP